MSIKFLFMITLVFIILVGCSADETLQINSSKSEQVITDIKTTNEFRLLDSSKDIIESSEQFSQVKAFIPDSNYMESQNVQDGKFSYIKLEKNQSTVLGKIILENKTNNYMEIQSFFIQGNKIAQVKTINSEKWNFYVTYNVKPNSSVEISVEIKWDNEGINELTFFPLDHSSPIDRYNGGNLSLIRYFVLDNKININNTDLINQSFNLDNKSEISGFFPIPSWVGNDDKEVEYVVEQEKIFTKNPISKLKLDAIPYDTEIDILLIDELGNISLMFEKVKIKKNQSTLIPLDSEVLNELNIKKYFIILNNRGKDMLFDMKALDLKLKPFTTTYQSVIEFYMESNSNHLSGE